MTDNGASLVKAMEGQISGLTLALIRIAKASADPAAVASELEIASRMFDDGSARSRGATFMLRDGNIWAGVGWVGDGYDGVHVFEPRGGGRIGQIRMPEICSNLCSGGSKRNRLFMTGSQSRSMPSLSRRAAPTSRERGGGKLTAINARRRSVS